MQGAPFALFYFALECVDQHVPKLYYTALSQIQNIDNAAFGFAPLLNTLPELNKCDLLSFSPPISPFSFIYQTLYFTSFAWRSGIAVNYPTLHHHRGGSLSIIDEN